MSDESKNILQHVGSDGEFLQPVDEYLAHPDGVPYADQIMGPSPEKYQAYLEANGDRLDQPSFAYKLGILIGIACVFFYALYMLLMIFGN